MKKKSKKKISKKKTKKIAKKRTKNTYFKRRKNPEYKFLFRGSDFFPNGRFVKDLWKDYRRELTGFAAGPQVKDVDGKWWSVNAVVKGNVVDVRDIRYQID